MSFLELLQPQGDKATANDFIEAKKLLPARVTASIPACLYDEDEDLDIEVVVILSAILARRENKDITISEVGERIGAKTSDLLNKIVQELVYFYSTNTREDIEKRTADAQKAAEADAPAPEVAEAVAPLE